MANTKKDRQFINGVTPKGECYYAFLRKPEMYEGNEVGYSIQIKMSEKDSKAFEDKLLTALEDAKDSFDLRAGKKWSKEPSYGKHIMKDGSVVGFEVDETGYNSKEDTRLKEEDDDDDMLEFVEGDEDSDEEF